MKPLRVFLADDEPLARERLRALLADISAEVPTDVVGEAANGMETIARVPGCGADVLLLDIHMPGMNGLEVARHLARLPTSPAVVFVTAHDEHAVSAFEVSALDYLLKPVRAVRLAEALIRARRAGAPQSGRLAQADAVVWAGGSAPRSHFSLSERNRIVLVPVDEVVYLKAEQKYVTLRTRQHEHLTDESLVALEREFADRFVRVHRNCLVARSAIRGFERAAVGAEDDHHWAVLLDGIEERLPVSRRQWAVVRELARAR